MYKKYFCSFADKRLHRSLNRISIQAKAMQIYDSIHVVDESFLHPDFRTKFHQYLRPSVRGYGYWSWKPQVILQILDVMDYGDILQYTDSGCHLNSEGKDKLLEYFEIASNSKTGILAFKSKDFDPSVDEADQTVIREYQYTKAELLDYFGVLNNIDVINSPQYQGGVIFIRKENETIEFVKKWIEIFSINFNFIDDTPSQIQELPGFIEHRHDQSIFSLLCKETKVDYLYTDEYYTKENWETMRDKPIWVKWDKDYGFLRRVYFFLQRKFQNYIN